MKQYVADQLIESARDRGRIPASAISSTKLLQIANEEMESYLAPTITGVQEDFYLSTAMFALDSIVAGALLDAMLDAPLYEIGAPATSWRIPSRAAGGSLREVSFLDSGANTIQVPRISVDDQEAAVWGVLLSGQVVTYINRVARTGPAAMRMTFAMTPSMLTPAASCARVADIVGNDVTVEAIPTPDNPVSGATAYTSTFPSATAWDLVKGTPGFEVIGVERAGTYSGGVITLTAAPPSTLEVGDYVALPHYTPVPQCPTAMWPVLAQAVAATALERLGQMEEATQAMQRRAQMEAQSLPLLKNRIRGNPMSMVSRKNILASTRRW